MPEPVGWNNVWGAWHSYLRGLEDEAERVLDLVDTYGADVANMIGTILSSFPVIWEFFPMDALAEMLGEVIGFTTDLFRSGLTEDTLNDLACYGFCGQYADNRLETAQADITRFEDQYFFPDSFHPQNSAKWLLVRLSRGLKTSWKWQRLALGHNSPDADWQILCECQFEPFYIHFDPARTVWDNNNFEITIEYDQYDTLAHVRATNLAGEIYRGFNLQLLLVTEGTTTGPFQLRCYGHLPDKEWHGTEDPPARCDNDYAISWNVIWHDGGTWKYVQPETCETLDDNHILYTYTPPLGVQLLRLEEPYPPNCRANPDHGFPVGATLDFYLKLQPLED